MNAIERAWRDGGVLATSLRPLGALYRALVAARAAAYAAGLLAVAPSPLPLVVVGNLSVGGTGKTPLTGHLVGELRRRGWRPGIVSRGHGGARHVHPRHVRADDRAADVGDEPLMLHRESGAPVCVCVHRARAVAALARDTDCDVVLSDDGLQHRRMARDVEIVVVDAARGLGNGRLLPAGPLREPPARLRDVDLIAVRVGGTAAPAPLASVPGSRALDLNALPPAFRFATTNPRTWRWPDGERRALDAFRGRRVHAVAGIAHPERFFGMLSAHGLDVDARALPDHHALSATDLAFDDAAPVLITTKDAVRLDGVAPLPSALHVVAVEVELDAAGERALDALSARLREVADMRTDKAPTGATRTGAPQAAETRGAERP